MSEKAPENSPFPRAGFTMLAPMQDVTTLPFMRLLARRGAPDFFVTEFLRVSATSPIDDSVAECAEKTLPLTGKPLLVQLLGEDVPALTRVAREVLERFAGTVAGIDFNLGCPMPKIFRRNVGGGLLRDLEKVEEILGALRRVCADFGKLFTVKCRLGFEDAAPFPRLLEIVRASGADLLAVHGRTVRGLYRSPVDYGAIAFAAEKSACPVAANGEISSVAKALANMRGVRHRIERVDEVAGVVYVNDSKGTNIDAALTAVSCMQSDTVLLLGGKDKGYDYDELFVKLRSSRAVHFVLYGENRFRLLNSAVRANESRISLCDDFDTAVRLAAMTAKPGQCVLLSPASSSFDAFSGYEERGERFESIVMSMKERSAECACCEG